MPTVDPEFLSQIRYRCIGPTRGGRVVAVAADPVKQAVFYFGACAGGVWKTDDAGLYWENVSDGFFTSASIGALAVAPSDGNVIYAGTGEATIRIDVSHGDGVYKSTDAGSTWSHIGLPESRHIGEIVVDPNNPDVVYVAALGHMSKSNPERGLYRSTDGGDTWDLVLHVTSEAGAIDVSLDPHNPRILFATTWETKRTFWSIDSGGSGCRIWRSRDGGDTWEDLSSNPGLPDGTLGKMGVSVSPAQTGRVFAMIEAEGRKRGLYRTDDYGESWEKVSSKAELGWRPWYYEHVTAHPTDPETVYIMNMKAWVSIDGGKNFEEFITPHGDNHALWIDPINPDRMIGCDDGGAWVSVNAGRSWSTIYNQLTAQFYHIATDDQFPYLVYGSQQDNSSIAVPSRSGNGAITWGHCFPPGTAESGYVAPKPGDSDTVFVGAIGSSPGGGDSLQKYDHKTKQIQLVSVWPEAYHDGNTAEVRFQWTYPIVFSPQDADTLYATGNKVFRTRDEGHSWDTISPDLTYADPDTMGVSGPLTMDTAGAEMYATIFSFVVSAHEAGTLMTGSDDGLVHVSHNDGADWQNVTPPGLEKFSQVTMLAESPHNSGTVYMSVARHKMGDYRPYLYKTTDFGQSWDRIDAGIPDNEFCRVIREDPNREGLLYVGTELGLHVSFDDGQSWQPLQANLPITPVYDLLIKDTDLVVATHGRSIWIMDDLTQIHQIHKDLTGKSNRLLKPRDTVRYPEDLFAGHLGSPGGKNYHVVYGQNATYYQEQLETGHTVRRLLDAGEDLERGVRFTYYLTEQPAEATLTLHDSAGKLIDSFSSIIPEDPADRHGLYMTATAGMNSFQWPLHYAEGVKVLGSDYHGRPGGPVAQPGEYTATLSVGGSSDDATSDTQTFRLIKDPRVTTSDEDLAEQFNFLILIQDKLSEIATAVNVIRSVDGQISSCADRLGNQTETNAMAAMRTSLSAIEDQLIQKDLTSPGDSLNYREMLFEKISALPPIVASADARPTVQSYDVYDKLVTQADEQLAKLATLMDSDLDNLNQGLTKLGVGVIGV